MTEHTTTARRARTPGGSAFWLALALAFGGCAQVPPSVPAGLDKAAERDEQRVGDTRLVGAAAIEAEDDLAWQLLERGHQRRLRELAAKRLDAQRAALEAALRAAAADTTPEGAKALREAAAKLLDAPRDQLVSVGEVETLRTLIGDAHGRREATLAEFRQRLTDASGGAPAELRAAIKRALEQLDSTRAAYSAVGDAAVGGLTTAIDAAAAKKAADRARKLADEAAAAKAAAAEGGGQ